MGYIEGVEINELANSVFCGGDLTVANCRFAEPLTLTVEGVQLLPAHGWRQRVRLFWRVIRNQSLTGARGITITGCMFTSPPDEAAITVKNDESAGA